MIIGISGLTFDKNNNRCSMSSGKSALAEILSKEYNFLNMSLADPMKRVCKDLFHFTDEQLWGPSKFRNFPDLRYWRNDAKEFLTARYALISFGTGWGRSCWEDVWINYAIRTIKEIELNNWDYNEKCGIIKNKLPYKLPGVIITDLRYYNEFKCIKDAGGALIRIKRPVEDLSLLFDLKNINHSSEKDMLDISDNEFNFIINNDGNLSDLKLKAQDLVKQINTH
jgi:hypothetical protein